MASTKRNDQERFDRLVASLAKLGWFRRGSVQRRYMPCGKAGCRCQADPPQLHGPYFQWTRKVNGKTITVRLTEDQARLTKKWIANAQRLDRIVANMERVAHRLTEPLLQAAKHPHAPN